MLYIITIEPVEPDKYRSIAEDLVEIRDFLKANKKYYKGNKSIPNQ